MASILRKCLVVILAAFLLSSCGMVARPGQDFSVASRECMQRLRWMDYPAVAGYLSEEHREDFLDRFYSLADLHIVDVRLERVELREDERRAETTTVIEYYLLPSTTVKEFFLHLEWAYTGGDRYHAGFWQITTPFPPFP